MNILQSARAWAKRVKRDAVTLWIAGRHPRTPWLAKALGLFVVAYALSPIDLIPDFVPVLGYVDDVLLLPALIWVAIRLLPADVLDECRARRRLDCTGRSATEVRVGRRVRCQRLGRCLAGDVGLVDRTEADLNL